MIAFIGAMQLEVDALVSKMTEVQKKVYSGTDFYLGKLSEKDCIVMKSGIGKVASSMTTTILLENFQVSKVINIGTAGGIQSHLKVLDVVVSLQVTQHDLDVPGWDKGFDKAGFCYYADERLVENIRLLTEKEEDRVWFGNIVTGDCFIYLEEQLDRLKKEYPEALCAEMEGASIAKVCDHYKIPFIIIRSLSDIVFQEGNEMSFDEYADKASARSAKWCEKLIEMI